MRPSASPLWQPQHGLVPIDPMRSRIGVALFGAVATLVLTIALGQWQLRRADEKLTLQKQWDDALHGAPVAVSSASVGSIGAHLPARVRLTGNWLHAQELWLENRIHEGVAGFHVLTPLRTRDGTTVLVDRGFAPRDPRDIRRLPDIERPDGLASVDAIAVAQPSRVLQLGADPSPAAPPPRVWQNLDHTAFERATGLTTAPWVALQLGPAAGGLKRAMPRMGADVDRHRGYAFQWFALAGLTAFLALFLSYRALRRRSTAPTLP